MIYDENITNQLVRITLSSKGNMKFDFRSTITDVKLHKNKLLHACPQKLLIRPNILSEMGVYE